MNNLINNINILSDTAKTLGCTVFIDKSLAEYTSFKVGGKCNAVIKINSENSISELFRLCNELNIPYLVLGKGSNMLIDDDGFIGVAFVIGNDYSSMKLIDECTIECDSGCAVSSLAYFAYKNGLSGLEFAWGIPGTVGGAVAMNAGAYGGEISDVIISSSQSDENGNITVINKVGMHLSYRHSIFSDKKLIITKAQFRLVKAEKDAIKEKMDDFLHRRKSKQPLEFASAGSTFKRPEGAFAGKLIEDCGLKGFSVGDAEVSTKHSGFVINKGNATFNQIIEVINKVKEVVYNKTGYSLECEVKIIKSHK